jgi:glycosyltransferase involved in cell wall biosynthesis
MLDQVGVPVVRTLHLPPDRFPEYVEIPPMISENTWMSYVAVSKFEQSKCPVLCRFFVYNGLEITTSTFNPAGGEQLKWIGRVSPKTPKGLKEAVLLSKQTGHGFEFSASIGDQVYYDQEITPILDETTRGIGETRGPDMKSAFIGSAKGMLFPIQWEEPFGFVFTESMACGTPLLAYARGSVPEIIEDGVTGYIVNASDEDIRGNWIVKKTGEAGMKEAIERLYALPSDEYRAMRLACRMRVETLFTAEVMAREYEKIYQQIRS